MNYTIERELSLNFEDALEDLRHQLRHAEFEIVSRIDMQKLFDEEIGEKTQRCVIFGVLPPALTYEALQIEDKLVNVLPFNIVLEEESSGATKVSCIDAEKLTKMIKNPGMHEVIKKIRDLIAGIIDEL